MWRRAERVFLEGPVSARGELGGRGAPGAAGWPPPRPGPARADWQVAHLSRGAAVASNWQVDRRVHPRSSGGPRSPRGNCTRGRSARAPGLTNLNRRPVVAALLRFSPTPAPVVPAVDERAGQRLAQAMGAFTGCHRRLGEKKVMGRTRAGHGMREHNSQWCRQAPTLRRASLFGPLCLLSGLAAHLHVRVTVWEEREEALPPTS
jgi:hypothetical protein